MNRALTALLGLKVSPIAITFCDTPPAGVAHVARPDASSCSYWKRASEGETFYTDATDQLGCAVGAHTHNVPMGPEKQQELQGMIGTMVGLEYLTMAEVPAIPQRTTPFKFAVYAPLDTAVGTPDLVLVRADVRQLMLLTEAAQAAGVGSGGPTLGRPTCAVLPAALNATKSSSSFGCIGNRVYTGASANEGYFAVPGSKLEALEARLAIVMRANQELEKFHQQRLATVAPR